MILLQSQYQAEKNEENQFVLNFLLFGINNRSSSFFSFVFFIIFFIAIEPIHFSINARCKGGNTKQEYQIMPTVIATTPRMHMCIHFFSSWISYLAHMICVRRCVSVTAIHVAYKYWWMRKKILWLYGFCFVWTKLKKNSSTLFGTRLRRWIGNFWRLAYSQYAGYFIYSATQFCFTRKHLSFNIGISNLHVNLGRIDPLLSIFIPDSIFISRV